MSLIQDLKFALRLIAKERWFTFVAVTALALGIGVNATVFTLVNAVLIRGLPFHDSGNLYMLGTRRAQEARAGSVSVADLRDWRAQSKTFEGLAAFSGGNMTVADDRSYPEQIRGTWLTANAFRVLGQQPLMGRDFAPAEDQKGAERVVILGYSVWKNRYGSDQNILGRTLRLNGEPATIIGVMPEGMQFPTNSDLWATFIPTAEQERRDNRPFNVFGRLRTDSSRAQAQAEMDGIAGQLAAQYPDTNKELTGVVVETFNDRFNGGPIRRVFLSLMGAVGFVLLIACANVANLLLSRSVHRTREIAVRVALGASRWRVVRQLLVESIVLGFIGGAIGLLLAIGGVRVFDAAVADSGKPYWIQFTMDWIVLGFLTVICVVTGVLFGLAPALQVSRTNVNDVLKEGGRGNAGSRRARWLSSTMVVVELALTLVLLVGAGLMMRSFLKMYSLDIGIQTDNLMSMRLQLPVHQVQDAGSAARVLRSPRAEDCGRPRRRSGRAHVERAAAGRRIPRSGNRGTTAREGRRTAERHRDRHQSGVLRDGWRAASARAELLRHGWITWIGEGDRQPAFGGAVLPGRGSHRAPHSLSCQTESISPARLAESSHRLRQSGARSWGSVPPSGTTHHRTPSPRRSPTCRFARSHPAGPRCSSGVVWSPAPS